MLNEQQKAFYSTYKSNKNKQQAFVFVALVLFIVLLFFVCHSNKSKSSSKFWQPDLDNAQISQEVALLSSLEINKVLAEHPAKNYYIDRLIQEGISMSLPDTNVKSNLRIISTLDLLSEDKISQIYEEPLPEEVVVDDDIISEKYKPITDVDIKINKKPPYFGPTPLIVIVIDDMGISPKRTKDISSLQAPITSAFLTYAKNAHRQMDLAKQNGHEIILHVPMEPKVSKDVAPDTLTTVMRLDEIKINIEKMLNKFPEVKGVNNHMGSKLTEDKERMEVVMDALAERNLFFLDSKTSASSVGEKLAKEKNVKHAHRHVFLDNQNDFNYISQQLLTSEKIAKKYGYAIAIGHPKSQTFEALKAWLPSLKEKNIKLVHLSEVIDILNK